jgi:hypothetical protein
MEKNMALFHHVSRVLSFGAVLGIAAAINSVSVTPASAQVCDYDQRGNCILPPGPVVPQIWTAIAISKSTLRNATAWQAQTQYAAEKAALDRCGTVSSDCVIAISGANICIALALSLNRAWSTSQADNYIGADNEALAGCAARGGTKCVVTADPCYNDGPVNNGYTSLAP